MAKTRRRPYPTDPTEEQRDRKYGNRGNARASQSSYKEKKGKGR